MSDHEDERFQITDLAVADEAPETILEQLAAKHRQLAENKEVNIPVPGYDREPPMLFIRYRLLEGTEINTLAEKIRRETRNKWQRQLYAAVDTFIKATVGFYCDNGDGVPKPLMYQGEHLVRWDDSLATALGFESELPPQYTARQVAFSLFNNNDAAIVQHNMLLNAWFADTSLDIQAELLGNL